MEQMKTSIDWLFEEIRPCICRDEVCDLLYELRDELEAKHKEEIVQSVIDTIVGSNNIYDKEYPEVRNVAEEYYNKTFKQDAREQN